MRKSLQAVLIVAAILVGTAAFAAGETFGGLPVVQVMLNGKILSTPGVLVEGRSMASVQAIADSLGGEVRWDEAASAATITVPDTVGLQREVAALQTEVERLKAENARLRAAIYPNAPTPAPWNGVSTRTNPAGIGNTQTIFVMSNQNDYSAQVTLLEVVRGDEAWQQIQAADPSGDPPREGKEYIVARFRFELVTIVSDKTLNVGAADFVAVSGTGGDYDRLTSVTAPQPSLSASLRAGSSHEGWVSFEVDKTDTAPVAAYGRRFDGTGGIWFSLATE